MRKTIKKPLIIILSVALIFCATGIAWAASRVGGEQMDLTGTIDNERNSEMLLLNFFAGTASVLASKDDSVLGFGATVTSMFSSNRYIPPWYYYPAKRYGFDYNTDTGIFSFVEKKESRVVTSVGNLFFAVNIMTSFIGIEILNYAFYANWIDSIVKSITSPMLMIWQGGNGSEGVKYIMFSLGIILVGGYMVFRLAQRRIGDIFRAFIVTALVIVTCIVYFSYASPIISTISGFTDTVAGVFMSAVSPVYNPSDSELANKVKPGKDQVIAGFMNTTWNILVTEPWAWGEFGTTDTDQLILTDDEYKELDKDNFKYNGKEYGNEISAGMRIDTLILAQPYGSKGRQEIINVLAKEEIDHGKHPQTIQTLSQEGRMDTIRVSFFAQIGALIFLILVIICAGSMILAQFLLAILFLCAPFVAIFAIIPEGGWNLGIKYVRMVLAAFATKIFYGAYLSVIMMTAEAAQNVIGANAVGGAIAIDGFIFIVAIWLRKRVIDMMRDAVANGTDTLRVRAESIANREKERSGGPAKRFLGKAISYGYMAQRLGKAGSALMAKDASEAAATAEQNIQDHMSEYNANQITGHYEDKFMQRYGYKPVLSEKDRQIVSSLGQTYSPDDINNRMDKWFEVNNPKVHGKGDIESFARNIKMFGEKPVEPRQHNSLKVVRWKNRQNPQVITRPDLPVKHVRPVETRNNEVVQHYQDSFKSRFGKPPVITEKDRQSLASIPETYTSAEVNQLVDRWIDQNNRHEFGNGDLQSFTRNINKFVAEQNRLRKQPSIHIKDNTEENPSEIETKSEQSIMEHQQTPTMPPQQKRTSTIRIKNTSENNED